VKVGSVISLEACCARAAVFLTLYPHETPIVKRPNAAVRNGQDLQTTTNLENSRGLGIATRDSSVGLESTAKKRHAGGTSVDSGRGAVMNGRLVCASIHQQQLG
jgi:hypothetical protein